MNKELFQETSTAIATTGVVTTSSIESNYTWEVNPDDPETVTITSFRGQIPKKFAPDGSLLPVSSLNIPYMLGNKITTIIGRGAFEGNTEFDRVVFHPDILAIETGAFANCTKLKYIAFNSNSKLQYIKEEAFINTLISNPIIPASVVKIETAAFNTQKLTSVTFLGNCPVITSASFNTQNTNDNVDNKIAILYFNDAIGFDNIIDDKKFLYVANYRMKLPPEETPQSISESKTSIYRYINYSLLVILSGLVLYVIYELMIKKRNIPTEIVEYNI